MVMPRSRSMSIESSTCACICASLGPAAELDEAVGECRLAVIDVRDDGKIADVLRIPATHASTSERPAPGFAGQEKGAVGALPAPFRRNNAMCSKGQLRIG